MKRWGLLAAAAVFAADQASKWWIVDVLRLPELPLRRVDLTANLSFSYVENVGITFGLLSGRGAAGHAILALVALAVVAGLAVWLWRAESRRVAVAVGAIAGGALGNILDRVRLGYVVDFIHVHAGDWSWYVFNVADAAIDCGVALLLIDSLLASRKAPPALPASTAPLGSRDD